MEAEVKAGELYVWTGTECDCIGPTALRSLVVDHGLGAILCAVILAAVAFRLLSRVTGRGCREGLAMLCAAAGFALGCGAWAAAWGLADVGPWVVSHAAALDLPKAAAGVRYLCGAWAGLGALSRAARACFALRRGEGGAAFAHAMFGLFYASLCVLIFALDGGWLMFPPGDCFGVPDVMAGY